MKKIVLAAVAMMVVLGVPAMALDWNRPMMITGSGEAMNKTYAVGAFDTVSIKDIPKFQIMQGDRAMVMVKTNVNIASHMTVTTAGGRLEIALEPGYTYNPSSFQLDITVPKLAAAAVYDSKGSIGQFDGTDVELSLFGKSAVDLSGLNATNVALRVSGRSSIKGPINSYNADFQFSDFAQGTLSGSTDHIRLVADGTAHANLEGLQANRTNMTLSSDASARINGNHGMSVRGFVVGGARLSYMGKVEMGSLFIGQDASVGKA